MDNMGIWTCKIGYADRNILPGGSDRPMALAAERVFYELAGKRENFCFSGWGGCLTENELAVVEDRMPKISNSTLEIIEQLSTGCSAYLPENQIKIIKIMEELKNIVLIEKLHEK